MKEIEFNSDQKTKVPLLYKYVCILTCSAVGFDIWQKFLKKAYLFISNAW